MNIDQVDELERLQFLALNVAVSLRHYAEHVERSVIAKDNYQAMCNNDSIKFQSDLLHSYLYDIHVIESALDTQEAVTR